MVFHGNLGVSVVCSTNKPNMIKNILDNFICQDYINKELIIIINYDTDKLDSLLYSTLQNVSIFYLGSKYSLGNCLNYGVEKSKYNIIAKFDDDDYYGPNYLSHSIKSLGNEKVGIVGKACYFVYFSEKQLLGIKNIGKENQYVNRVSGSTLVFRKKLLKEISFQDVNLGEDIKFCEDCLNIGYKIYSTNKDNYVYIRNKPCKHTWKMDNNYILKNCTHISKTKDFKSYIKKSI